MIRLNKEQKDILRTVESINSIYPDIEWKPVSKTRTVEEWVIVAEKLAKENGGILPIGNWLRKNGYRGLPTCMKKYPEKFSHIKRNRIT